MGYDSRVGVSSARDGVDWSARNGIGFGKAEQEQWLLGRKFLASESDSDGGRGRREDMDDMDVGRGTGCATAWHAFATIWWDAGGQGGVDWKGTVQSRQAGRQAGR